MNYKITYIAILLFLGISCNKISDINDRKYHIDGSKFKYELFNPSLKDTISVAIKNKPRCFNHRLDSLIELGKTNDLQLVDLAQNRVLISWHSFMGVLSINKVSERSCEFSAKIYLPKNGVWENYFREHEILKYTLEAGEDYYQFASHRVPLDLVPDEGLLADLRDQILKDSTCLTTEWEIANVCMGKIALYEYQLFLALMNGNLEYKAEYLQIRDKISIVNAGRFSEYLDGNFLLLAVLGIIDVNEYDLSRLYYTPHSAGEFIQCY